MRQVTSCTRFEFSAIFVMPIVQRAVSDVGDSPFPDWHLPVPGRSHNDPWTHAHQSKQTPCRAGSASLDGATMQADATNQDWMVYICGWRIVDMSQIPP